MLLFLTTNIAAVTSHANQQYDLFDVINNQNEYSTYAIPFLKFPGLLDIRTLIKMFMHNNKDLRS